MLPIEIILDLEVATISNVMKEPCLELLCGVLTWTLSIKIHWNVELFHNSFFWGENLNETLGFVLFICMGCQRILNSWKYRRVDLRENRDNEITELMRLLGSVNIYLVKKTLIPRLEFERKVLDIIYIYPDELLNPPKSDKCVTL